LGQDTTLKFQFRTGAPLDAPWATLPVFPPTLPMLLA